MDFKTISLALAALGCGVIAPGCKTTTDVTEVPGADTSQAEAPGDVEAPEAEEAPADEASAEVEPAEEAPAEEAPAAEALAEVTSGTAAGTIGTIEEDPAESSIGTIDGENEPNKTVVKKKRVRKVKKKKKKHTKGGEASCGEGTCSG